MKALGILFILPFLFLSCSSINKSHLNSGIHLIVKSDMNARIEVDTTKKLTGYASGVYLLHLFKISGEAKYADGIDYGDGKAGFFEKWFSKIHDVKAAASYNAIRTSNADVLVSPQYIIETNNWNPLYKQIKVKVIGYPGRIVSIKNKL
ncbi:MAG: hypothetical protein ACO20H_01870 [Bacteriovoracaceae bacterium]